MSNLSSILQRMIHSQFGKILGHSSVMKNSCCCLSSSSRSQSPKQDDHSRSKRSLRQAADEFEAPSPFKNPGPRRYGFDPKYMTQDILGDGDVHPSDLLTGPPWLLGFKGNERERLMRKMEWQGNRTRTLYPAEFNRMEKRIRYLTKIYNTRRHMRKKD